MRRRRNKWWTTTRCVGGLALAALLWGSSRDPFEVDRVDTPANFALPAVAIAPEPAAAAPFVDDELTAWGDESARRWNVALAGAAAGVPRIAGEQIYLTTAKPRPAAGAPSRRLLCLDRTTGRERWQRQLASDGRSARPATVAVDEDRVYVPVSKDGEIRLLALRHDGTTAWESPSGPAADPDAAPVDPLIHRALVITGGVAAGPSDWQGGVGGWLAAHHRQTGELIWRVRRDTLTTGVVPQLARVADRWQLLVTGERDLTSYDPATGKSLWVYHWPEPHHISAIVTDGESIYVSRLARDSEVFALRGDGRHNLNRSDRLWTDRTLAADALTMTDGHLHLIDADSRLVTLDTKTGEQISQHPLVGTMAAPLVRSGTLLYALNTDGEAFVFRVDQGQPRQISVNRLPPGVQSTPALCGSQLLVPTKDRLWCIGREAPPVIVRTPKDLLRL